MKLMAGTAADLAVGTSPDAVVAEEASGGLLADEATDRIGLDANLMVACFSSNPSRHFLAGGLIALFETLDLMAARSVGFSACSSSLGVSAGADSALLPSSATMSPPEVGEEEDAGSVAAAPPPGEVALAPFLPFMPGGWPSGGWPSSVSLLAAFSPLSGGVLAAVEAIARLRLLPCWWPSRNYEQR